MARECKDLEKGKCGVFAQLKGGISGSLVVKLCQRREHEFNLWLGN